jgi:TetR/AcrR family transcriptional regulator, transcriptional repressor for nem operon
MQTAASKRSLSSAASMFNVRHKFEEPPYTARKTLLWAAYEEIHRQGYQGARVDRILRAAGLTKGAFYHYFPSKLELAYAVVDECISRALEIIWLKPLREAEDPIERLRSIIQSHEVTSRRHAELGCPVNNLAQEMSPVDEGFRQKISAVFQAWQGAIESALRKGQAQGLVRADVDPINTALLILATLEGCIGMGKNARSMDVLKNCLQGLLSMLDDLRA